MTAGWFVVAGAAILVARPALLAAGDPVLVVTVLFAVVLAGALLVRPADLPARGATPVVVAIAIGVAAFAIGRLVGGAHAPAALSTRFIVLNCLAAVAEEAFFRRVVYGVLAPAGAAFAVGGAAVLFAIVHVATYGAWVLPIDIAAGLVFGWQRWATGSWSAPAATHAVANVLVVM